MRRGIAYLNALFCKLAKVLPTDLNVKCLDIARES